jgi:triacylglycerol lipase
MCSRNPVLLVHGIDDTEAIFNQMTAQLRGHGWQVHCVNLIPNNVDVPLERLAEQVAHYIETNFARSQPVDLIGFSMGGLVSRYYVQRLGGIDRVERLITIASPHKGTWAAFLRSNPGARQMRPSSTFLRDLNSDAAVLDRIRFTSIWTPTDLMIVPSNSSVLPSGLSLRVSALAHPLMVRDTQVLRLVRQILADKDSKIPDAGGGRTTSYDPVISVQ